MENQKLPIFSDKPEGPKQENFRPAPYGGNVAVVTLGCAKNIVDSEVMLGALNKHGFRAVDAPEQADVIVVNTCAFLQSAVEEGIDRILELSEHRTAGRCRKLIVAGCMVERYQGDLKKELPEVDAFLSTHELLKVGELATESTDYLSSARRPYFLYDETSPRILSTASHTAYVKIAEGCDRPCAFCIIPKLRGSFRSRPIESVVAEVRGLIDSGVREVNFVAQDLTAYGLDREKKPMLAKLLRDIDALKAGREEFWVRLLYAYPIGVDDALLDVINNSTVVCPYLDLPLQHISSPVLKSMRRPLGGRRTRELIEKIRTQSPQLALRTTFIVGFPGETEEDVEALREFVSAGHFTHVGTFCYSDEEEASSFEYPNRVPEEEKERRRGIIMAEQQRVVEKRNTARIDSIEKVLFEGPHEETNLLFTGRAAWQAPETDGQVIINEVSSELSHLEGNLDGLRGKFVQVKITEAAGYDVVGELVAVSQ